MTTIATAIYLKLTETSVIALGFKMKWDSVVAILPGTLSLALLQLLLLALIPWLYGQLRSLYLSIDYIWYFYITIFQEIIWRGLAFLLLDKICLRSNQKIFTSAILFTFMHIYFKSILVIVGSFILGIHWGQNYHKYRSLLGVSISHYILGLSFSYLTIWELKQVGVGFKNQATIYLAIA